MAVTTVTETWNSRRGSVGERNLTEYTRSFQVLTDDARTAQVSVLNAPGLPRRYDSYQDADGNQDLNAVCKALEARQDQDDPTTWVVEASYGTLEPGDESPLLRPTEIEWGSNKFTKVLTQANDGTPVKNSAGESFDPPLEVEEYRLTLKFVRNEANYDPNVLGVFFNTTNMTAWYGFQPNEVVCRGISASRQYEKGSYYWKVTYEFEAKPGEGNLAWAFRVLDQGYFELDVSGNKLLIRDKFLAPLTAPALLDGTGKKLAAGAAPVFLNVFAYKGRDFNTLNLP